MTTVAIVQARMGSTRLPAKVLLDLAGEPMIARVVHRLRRALTLDQVVIATTTQAEDDVLASFCETNGLPYFRGDADDVLDRYYRAAENFGAETIVRITSDCPLIEPEIVDRTVEHFRRQSPPVAYACNFLPRRTFPRGLDTEVIRFAALESSWREATNLSHREHVTPHIYAHPDRFPIVGLTNEEDRSDLRWTVDTPEDLAVVRHMYDHFGHDRFSWQEAIALADQHPDWAELNRDVPQKQVT